MIKVKILGSGCANCRRTQKLIETVCSENAIPVEIEKIEDMNEILSYGILNTPGVVIEGKIAHAGGVPDKKTILSWFKPSCCPTDEDCC